MKQQANEILGYVKSNTRLLLIIASIISLIIIAAGAIIPQDDVVTRRILIKMGLIQLGTSIFISSTIGVLLTESYKKIRELTIQHEISNLSDRIGDSIQKEIHNLIDGMRDSADHPERFQLQSHMKQAGLLAFYPDRKGDAENDLRSRIENLLEERKPVTIYLMGDTLRVFFLAGNPFVEAIHKAIYGNPNITLKLLVLNPNCKLALYRSESEATEPPFKSDEQYKNAPLFRESVSCSNTIKAWNCEFAAKWNGVSPIEVRYYDCADYCLSVIFPDICYTSPYLYADHKAQVDTPHLPMMKYSRDSNTYKRLLWHFDWVWKNCSVTYEEVNQSLKDSPVVQLRTKENAH